MRLIIHCGLHRAASTSFERWLEDRKPALDAQGILVAGGSSDGSLLGSVWGRTLELAGPEAAAAAIGEELAALAPRYRCAIITDENALGGLPRCGVPAFSAADRLARLLGLLSAAHEVVPVLILREHLAWLESLYRIAQFRCETAGYDVFRAEVFSGNLPFSGLLDTLAGAAPALQVSSLEAIAHDDGRTFLDGVCRLLDIGPERALSLPKSNVSPNRLVCALRQAVARRAGFLVLKGQKDLLAALTRLSQNPDQPRPERVLVRIADMVCRQTVRMPESPKFHERLALGQALTGGGGPPWLSAADALTAVADAVEASARPLVTPAVLTRLRAGFAADRRAIASRHAVLWDHD